MWVAPWRMVFGSSLRMILKTSREDDERDVWEALENDHCSVLFCELPITLYERTKYYPRERIFSSHQNSSGFRNKGPMPETAVWWKTEMLQCTNLFDVRREHHCYRIFRHMLFISLTVFVYSPGDISISAYKSTWGIWRNLHWEWLLHWRFLEINNADFTRTLYILLQ